MDVNALRRALLAITGGVDVGIEMTTITCNSAIANAEQLLTFLENNCPQCETMLLALNRDFNTVPSVDNTVVYVVYSPYEHRLARRFIRIRNGSYSSVTSFGNNYDAIVQAGASFTAVYMKPMTV